MPKKAKRPPHPHEIAAYGAFDRHGNLALGTIRFKREDCAEVAEKFSPTVSGYPAPLKVLPIYIGTDLNTQLVIGDL